MVRHVRGRDGIFFVFDVVQDLWKFEELSELKYESCKFFNSILLISYEVACHVKKLNLAYFNVGHVEDILRLVPVRSVKNLLLLDVERTAPLVYVAVN